MYQALYRAMRPEVFSEILGQEHIVKILKHQISTNTVSHAYVFCGTRGTGKTTTARLLAKAVNCLDADVNGRPCGKCENCKSIQAGTFMDVIEIDAASNNGVENIRELRESVNYPPAVGRKKVYIIDEVHMLSTGAFNALLKTLEEPPENVMFILATTEPQKLPQTILSRCMRLDFKRVPDSILIEGMRNICVMRSVDIEDGALKILANAADGSVRDGLSILDQVLASGEKKIDRETVLEYIGLAGDDFFIDLTELVLLKKTSEALILLNGALSDGKDVKQLMRDWNAHYRNLLITKFVKNPEDMLNMSMDNIAKVKEQANSITSEEINDAILTLTKAISDARYSTQPRILMELAIVSIASGLLSSPSQTMPKAAKAMPQTAQINIAQSTAKNETLDVSKTLDPIGTEFKGGETGAESSATPVNTNPTVDNFDKINIPSDLKKIWEDVVARGEDGQGSFALVRTATILARMDDKTFTVLAKTSFAKQYLMRQEALIEKLIMDVTGKALKMQVEIPKEDSLEEKIVENASSEIGLKIDIVD